MLYRSEISDVARPVGITYVFRFDDLSNVLDKFESGGEVFETECSTELGDRPGRRVKRIDDYCYPPATGIQWLEVDFQIGVGDMGGWISSHPTRQRRHCCRSHCGLLRQRRLLRFCKSRLKTRSPKSWINVRTILPICGCTFGQQTKGPWMCPNTRLRRKCRGRGEPNDGTNASAHGGNSHDGFTIHHNSGYCSTSSLK
jgi:hypothetical protein